MMEKSSKIFDFSQYREIEDPMISIEYLKAKFKEIKDSCKEEIVLQLTNPEFYNFLKNGYQAMKNDDEFVNFICSLEIDDFFISKYQIRELITKCTERKNKSSTKKDEDSDYFRKKVKREKRVSFALQKNSIRYYIPEQSIMKHGNYGSKDKQEAAVLKDIWLHPMQIKQFTKFKTESTEYVAQKKREASTLSVLNTTQNDFTPSESFISPDELLPSSTSHEFFLINLNLTNNIPEMEIENIDDESDDFNFSLIDLINDVDYLNKISS